jgi:hypothetical protein
MTTSIVDSCSTKLDGSLLAQKEVQKLIKDTQKKIAALEKKIAEEKRLTSPEGDPLSKGEQDKAAKLIADPTRLAEIKEELWKGIESQIEEGLEFKAKQVADLVRVQDLYHQVTTDPFNKQTLKTGSEVVLNRLNRLVGKNSVDTKLRVLRNHFRNYIDEFEMMFQCGSNEKFKSIRDIAKGTDEEAELYMKVYQFMQQPDIENISMEKAAAMVKGKGDLDKLAMALIHYNEYTRKAMGQFGVSVKFNPNYVMKRRYDWASLKEMGQAKWADYMSDKLDLKKTFGDGVREISKEEAVIALRNVWSKFEANAQKRTSVLSSKTSIGAKDASMEVKFFYKDAKSAYESFRDNSVGGMREQFEHNAMGMAGTAIQISEFGYNSAKVLERLQKKIDKAYPGDKTTMDQWRESRILAAEKELSGQQNIVQGSFTNFVNNWRFMTAFTKLGTTLATTVGDAVANNRHAFYVNGDLFGGMMEWSNNMRKMISPQAIGGYSKEEMQEIANTFGAIMAHQSNSEGLRMATGDLATNGGALTRLIQTHGGMAMNLATLLPTQTGWSKVSSVLGGASQFAKLMDDAKTGKLNKFQLETLNEYGFSKQEVALLNSGLVERHDAWSSRTLFSGTGVRRLLDTAHPEQIAGILGVKPEMAGRAVVDLSMKVDSFINDALTDGTPTPELRTKTLLSKGVENQYLRGVINLTTQFMDTPLAQAESFVDLSKKLYRVNLKDGKLDKIGMTKDMMSHLSIYTVAGVSMYLATDAVISALTNSESMLQKAYRGDEEERRRVFIKSISKIAVLPYVSELIDNQWGGGYNKTAMDTFIGPNWGTVRDSLRLIQSNEDGGMEVTEFLKRQGPSNAHLIRGFNNWAAEVRGNKLWDDNKGTFR